MFNKEVLAGVTIEECERLENKRINDVIEVEREWWMNHVIDNPDEALKEGSLIVVPEEGTNYRLIKRIREEMEPKMLRPEALKLLKEISFDWRTVMEEKGFNTSHVWLSVSSLYRDARFQEKLQKVTYRASSGVSAHVAGVAIDFDSQGYYEGRNRLPISWKSESFNLGYIEALKQVIERHERLGNCHVINEKGFKWFSGGVLEYSACFHVCMNPDFR